MNYLEKLLDGAEVEYKPLGDVAEIKRGTSITKKNVTAGSVPVIAGGRKPAYYHNESNRTGQSIVIAGSGAYAGFVSWWEKPIFVSDAFTVKPNNSLLPRYCFYFLQGLQQQLHDFKSGGGVPHVYPRNVAPLEIPIPCPENPEKSLKIQGEIVRILDTFSALTAELTAELTARKKQYNYYRDQLLTFSDDAEVEWKPLGEVTQYEQPTKYLVKTKNYNDDYQTPVLTAGKTFILGHTNETNGIYAASNSPVIIFDDFTTANKWVDFDFKAKSSAMKMITSRDENKVLLKYIYYWLNTLPSDLIEGDHKRQWISNYSHKKIPIPTLEKQQEIVTTLDKFHTLTNSISEGLPREIELRQKQYEYYRDLLLNFPKPEEAA